jgi:hypothetical protein
MFKNCTFNINILPDDKHQQDELPTHVKFDSFWRNQQDDINCLLKELHLVEGADYYWEDYRLIGRVELWVMPTCFGQVYNAIQTSADVEKEPLSAIHISSALGIEDNELLTQSIYDCLSKHKTIFIEFDKPNDIVYIYKVNQNAN